MQLKLLSHLAVPPPVFSSDEVSQIAQDLLGISGGAQALGGERDANFLIRNQTQNYPERILIKISNQTDSEQSIEMQCQALAHIQKVNQDIPVQRLISLQNGADWVTIQSKSEDKLILRAFEFLPGETLNNLTIDARLANNIGQTLARLNLALRGFFHPAGNQPMAWNTQHLDQLRPLVQFVQRDHERKLITNILDYFDEIIRPALSGCRAQVIHNDISFHNILANPTSPTELTGIYDFGDMTFAPLIQDLTVATAEISAGSTDPFSRCAQIVAGFHSITPLEDVEFALLPGLMRARLALGYLIDSWTACENKWQDDRDHLVGWREKTVSMMEILEGSGTGQLDSIIRSVCGVAATPSTKTPIKLNDQSSWQRRKRFLGNADFYSYTDPIDMVRGQGVWLYDTAGKAYLDAYNNVPHVGHCHPKVVAAISRQTARLNTNTRYLYDALPSYAEKLTATLPAGLEVCYFVSSGSEANDLAWRIAKAWTGNSGGLVLKFAYHGVTDAVFDLSPAEKVGQDIDCPHIVEIDAPDDFRGPWKRDVEDRGLKYAGYCDDAVASLAKNGHRPAAFFMDMIMSTNGIMLPPPGYLPAVYEKVREAGGLCIADEVQSGFGRLGKAMWGFEVAGGIPDIVTFGKPIAGGYPMGLVVTRREISEKFEQSCQFFSTTGGNPVACAAASTILELVQQEHLMENAESIGGIIVEGIKTLAIEHSCIGDVRGSGLFIGVDLVSCPSSLAPNPSLAKNIANALKSQGVLVGVDGIGANVLKIRPPMVFNRDHCELLLETFETVLDRVN